MTSFSGRLADVGESRCNCLPSVKSKCFGKTVSQSSISQTSCSARNSTEDIESCGEKCANLCRVYKLIIAVSPVMDILSIWFLNYHVDLITLNLICWVINTV